MPRRVYKYPIKITDRPTVRLPVRHRVVLVGRKGNIVCIWAEVDTEAPCRDFTVAVFGTGHDIDDDRLEHAGSFQEPPFVWHVYLKEED